MIRLGISTLLYMFLINPICGVMTNSNVDFLNKYIRGISSFEFLGWSGPLWFALALLIFSIMYVAVRKWCDALLKLSFNAQWQNILVLILLITAFAFTLRIFFPRGTAVLNMQLATFSAYVFMFLVGILAYQKKIFEKIDYPTASKWFYCAFCMGVLGMWFFPHYVYYVEEQKMKFLGDGGINWISFLFALWESFICVAMSIALIGIFKERYNHQNPIQNFLSTNAFGVYFFHAPILIAVSIFVKHVEWPALTKWLIVSAITLPITFLFVSFIRSFSLCRKIFS